jgi:hypothetical protein
MIQSFLNDVLIGIAVMGALAFGAIYLVVAACRLLMRHCYRDYKRQGGAKALAGKAAAQTAGHVLRRAASNWLK